MMKWSRFFWLVGILLIAAAGTLALTWYGVPEWLDGVMLWSAAVGVLAVTFAAVSLAFFVPAVKRRWWRKPIDFGRIRQRLGAFYYVSWGVLILNFALYLAIFRRAVELDRDLPGSWTELNRLFQAMSTVSMTLIFAYFFVMLRFSRYVHDEGSGANGDQ